MTRVDWSGVLAVLIVASMTADRATAQSADRTIALGEAYSFRSSILDEDRQLQISLPESYGRTTIAYPVLFVLDGSSHLLHATATARFLASARNRIPELIVVAIPNTNRNRDMTPRPGGGDVSARARRGTHPVGGAHVPGRSGADSLGHSLSASFAVHTLLNRPELFDAYVVASAPVWRYDGLADDIKQGFPRAARAGAAVYVSVGQHENEQLRDGLKRFADALRSAGAGEARHGPMPTCRTRTTVPRRREASMTRSRHGTRSTVFRSSRTCRNSMARVDCRGSRRTIGAPPAEQYVTERRGTGRATCHVLLRLRRGRRGARPVRRRTSPGRAPARSSHRGFGRGRGGLRRTARRRAGGRGSPRPMSWEAGGEGRLAARVRTCRGRGRWSAVSRRARSPRRPSLRGRRATR